MAYYAFLNSDNVVTEVITGIDENELIEGLPPVEWYANFRNQVCVQTSYNTRGGVHYGPDGQPDGGIALYKNYAGIGYNFDGIGFFEQQPHPSWILNPETYYWEPPVPRPEGKDWFWDEKNLTWIQ